MLATKPKVLEMYFVFSSTGPLGTCQYPAVPRSFPSNSKVAAMEAKIISTHLVPWSSDR